MLQTAELADDPGRALQAFLSGDEPGGDASGFRLGPFLVGADGLLQPASETVAPRFSVLWRGRTVRAWIEPVGSAGLRSAALSLEVVTGRVPSTASCAGGSDLRDRTFSLLRQLPGKLPRGWRLHLLPDHHFGISSDYPLPMPASAADMLTGLTSFLVCLDPYLEVLDEAGFGFGTDAPPPSGTANT